MTPWVVSAAAWPGRSASDCLQLGERFLEALQRRQGDAAVQQRLGIAGPERKGAVVGRKRFLEPREFSKRIAAIVERFDEIGLDRQRLVVADDRFIEAPQRH